MQMGYKMCPVHTGALSATSLYLTFMGTGNDAFVSSATMSGWGYNNVEEKLNACVNNAIFTWVAVSIKMSLAQFISVDVSVELYTLDLFCP